MRVHKHIYTLLSVVLLLASAVYIVLPKHAQAATTFTVTSTTDDVDSPDNNPGDGVCASNNVGNPCTLRAAIEEANALAGADTIEFNITPLDGSVKTIAPGSQLPDITSQVTIDGYTQDPTVSEPNTAVSPAPFNGTLLIEINGANAGSPGINGLTIRANNTIIQGLSINRFSFDGIVVAADDVKVWGNYLGTDPTGLIDRGNGGSGLAQSGGDNDNLEFGGLTASKRNIASGNDNTGLSPNDGSDNWVIQGNYFGLAANGTSAIPNASLSGSGALSIDHSNGTTIGGTATGATNVISGNFSMGIAPQDAIDLVIQGNYIGTDYTGLVALPNGGPGIFAGGDTNLIVGGSSSAARNIVSGNSGSGISLLDSTNFRVSGNYIGVASDLSALANGTTGVNVNGGTGVVGGTTSGEGNIIANSTSGFGLNVAAVSSAAQVSLLSNSIYNNDDMGIALDTALQPNDHLDLDTGPNDYLNAPVYETVSESAGNTTVLYRLDVPAGAYRIEFFSNTVADPSGSGEGETYLGFQDITHTGGGLQQFTHTLTGLTGVTNLALTATQRNMPTPSTFGASSQFGGPAPSSSDVSLEKSILNPESVSAGGTIAYQLTVTNNGIDDLDLTQFSNPFANPLIADYLDPDLTPANLGVAGPIQGSYFLSDVGNPDVTCLWGGPGSAAGLGLTTYGDYSFMSCIFTGAGDTTLEVNESLSLILTVNIAANSDMVFTNYAIAAPALIGDPDNTGISALFGSGEDYLGLLIENQLSDSPINNFASAAYPIPVAPSQTTQPTANNGALGTTGQIIYSWQMLGVFLVSTGLLVRQWRKKRYTTYSLRP